MKRLPEITINPFQLAVLLDETERNFYSVVIENYVYCSHCRGVAIEGVDVEEMYLTDLNDIRVVGRCRKCEGEVGRLFEFGEKKEFYEKACRFRESIKQ
jgi:hypothetical protein